MVFTAYKGEPHTKASEKDLLAFLSSFPDVLPK